MNLDGLDRIGNRLKLAYEATDCIADFDDETQEDIVRDMARELREVADDLERMCLKVNNDTD